MAANTLNETEPKSISPGQLHLDKLAAIRDRLTSAADAVETALQTIRGTPEAPPAGATASDAVKAFAATRSKTQRSFFPAAAVVVKDIEAASELLLARLAELCDQF